MVSSCSGDNSKLFLNLKAANSVKYLYAETKRISDCRHGCAGIAESKEWSRQNTIGTPAIRVAERKA